MFGKASLTEATCLDKYCSWSGQFVNASKSSIRFSKNTNLAISDAITSLLIPLTLPNLSILVYLFLCGIQRKEISKA
jgi:hypothetical protein